MAMKKVKTNYRVEVYPSIGYFSNILTPEMRLSKLKATCDEIVQSISRHVDNVNSIEIVFDSKKECEYCGSPWTEDNDLYNGCCGKDEEDDHNRNGGTVVQNG